MQLAHWLPLKHILGVTKSSAPPAAGRQPAEFTITSLLAAPRERVWERVTTPEGVNAELMPIVRMNLPRGIRRLDVESVPVGTPIGRCWLLLFGVIPFDWDDLVLERLDAPSGFHERSSMASMRTWEHERTLEPAAHGGCRVTDRVAFLPRVPFPAVWFLPLFRAVFRHRHRRLRAHFGELHAGS
jgi:ligand-binding SRPBCC domain-containing protein